jgi:hypothetical protein
MKIIRGDKLSGILMHAYMEISQENSLCSYLYLKPKCHVFHFIFSLFSPTKLENKWAQQAWCRRRAGTCGRREALGNGSGKVNMVQ